MRQLIAKSSVKEEHDRRDPMPGTLTGTNCRLVSFCSTSEINQSNTFFLVNPFLVSLH